MLQRYQMARSPRLRYCLGSSCSFSILHQILDLSNGTAMDWSHNPASCQPPSNVFRLRYGSPSHIVHVDVALLTPEQDRGPRQSVNLNLCLVIYCGFGSGHLNGDPGSLARIPYTNCSYHPFKAWLKLARRCLLSCDCVLATVPGSLRLLVQELKKPKVSNHMLRSSFRDARCEAEWRACLLPLARCGETWSG